MKNDDTPWWIPPLTILCFVMGPLAVGGMVLMAMLTVSTTMVHVDTEHTPMIWVTSEHGK